MRTGLKLHRNFFTWSFWTLSSAVALQLVIVYFKLPSACLNGSPAALLPFLVISASLLLFLSTLSFWIYSKKLKNKILSCIKYARHIADGNGNTEVYASSDSDDEFDDLAKILKILGAQLKESNANASTERAQPGATKEKLKVQLVALHDSFQSLSSQSTDWNTKSKTIIDQSNSAVSAAEKLHLNMISISSAAEQSKKNMDSIAAVTGEMNCNIEEITHSSQKANSIMLEAVSGVKNAFERIDTLGKASEEITSVIETIVEIAEQTKLLALNATIEAARAGEAGKGFAVVASEVKDLAAQTNDATRDIKNKIEAMRRSTESTIDEIRKISDVTQSMTHVVETIAAAVEEQSISSKNISKTISDAEAQTIEMNTNVADHTNSTRQMVEKTSTIHKNISDIFIDINKFSENATHINSLCKDICLSDLAE